MLAPDFFSRLDRLYPRRLAFPETADPAGHDRWCKAVLDKLRELLGTSHWTHDGSIPAIRREGAERLAGVVRERIIVDDGMLDEVPAYLLTPDPLPAKAPLVLALHGHGGYYAGSAMTAGVTEGVHPIAEECAEALNYGYGLDLARAGFVVICPDGFNFGSRLLLPDLWAQRDICDDYARALAPYGLTPLGLTLWGHQRVLDFGLSLPECNGAAGCVGLSYGGVTTLFLAAIEERIGAAVCSGALHRKTRKTAVRSTGCSAQRVPGMLGWFDIPDLALTIAPRPMHYELMTQDSSFAFPDSMAAYETVRAGYTRLGCADRVSLQVAETEHRYDGTGVAEFFQRYLG